jgi:hypothetical protein
MECSLRQLMYVSSSSPRGTKIAVEPILEQSRHNNAIDGISGLLWTDGVRFLQVLEGDREAVSATFARIAKDPRHHAIVTLSDREIENREFGSWSMAHRRTGDTPDEFDDRIEQALRNCSAEVRGTFQGLIAARRPA